MLYIAGVIIFIGVLIFIFWLINRQDNDYEELDQKSWNVRWQKIQALLQEKNDYAWRQAVIEADNIFDDFLKHKGFGGSSLGERLKVAQGRYKELRAVWPAHILRNRLVHETDTLINQRQAKKAVNDFQVALRVLGFYLNKIV
jgi:hypothetical protein